MPLTIGSRLGPYEIVAPIGAGGMGEVFRAKDTKLGRDVAIKVLPDALAGDPESVDDDIQSEDAGLLAFISESSAARSSGLRDSHASLSRVVDRDSSVAGPAPKGAPGGVHDGPVAHEPFGNLPMNGEAACLGQTVQVHVPLAYPAR